MNLISCVALVAAFALNACARNETPAAVAPQAEDTRLCSTYRDSEVVRAGFKDDWKARIAAASPEAAEDDINPVVDMFEQVTIGYCQADGAQLIPYYDRGEDALDPTLRETLIEEFFQRVTDSVGPPSP